MYLYLDYYLFNINNDNYKIYTYIIDQMDYDDDGPMSIAALDAAFDADPRLHGLMSMSGQQRMPYRTNYILDTDDISDYISYENKDDCIIRYSLDKYRTRIYIHFFLCIRKLKKTGAKMLHDLLIQLKRDFPTLRDIKLTADARVDYSEGSTKSNPTQDPKLELVKDLEKDQAKLNQYYTDIGFVKRPDDDNNNFDGNIDTIIYTIRNTIFGGNKNKRKSRNKRTSRNKRNRSKKTRKKHSKHYR